MGSSTLAPDLSELLSIVKNQSTQLDLIQFQIAQIRQQIDRIERLSHGAPAVRMAGNRVLVRTLVGNYTLLYFVEASDLLLAPHFIANGVYEPALTNYFLQNIKPTDHCLDIGANFGYFTCLMAKLAHGGRVVGVEADSEIFAIARDNVFANWCEGVACIVNIAASDGPGEITLYRRVGRSGNTSLVQIAVSQQAAMGEPPSQPFQVETQSIDSLLHRFGGRVDYIKIDVEGAEPLVFKGALQLMSKNPGLNIVMEWSPDQITSAGFTVSDFAANLESLELQPSIIQENGEIYAIDYSELLQKGFLTGVHFTRSR